jgi:hypothetical protein
MVTVIVVTVLLLSAALHKLLICLPVAWIKGALKKYPPLKTYESIRVTENHPRYV